LRNDQGKREKRKGLFKRDKRGIEAVKTKSRAFSVENTLDFEL
jgi:hypothetical protein